MKRIISIALVALMLVALALPVFADALPNDAKISSDKTGDGVNHLTNDVTVTVEKAAEEEEEVVVYKVDIVWGDLTFKYEDAVWNPDELDYSSGGNWENNNTRSVTVKNSSNAAVNVEATLATEDDSDIIVTLDDGIFRLESAAINQGITQNSFTVTLDKENSKPPKADTMVVGTITITLSTDD